MAKSIAEMANEILGGALDDPSINPFDAQGKQHTNPAVPSDYTLHELNDSARNSILESVTGKEYVCKKEYPKVEPIVEVERAKREKGIYISESDLKVLRQAKAIIQKIEEATTVGCIGTGSSTSTMKKRKGKTKKSKAPTNNFVSYLKKC
jgi:hypothetical protein